MTGPIPDRVAERAATRYVVDGECWVSTYSTGSHGYAQIGWHDDEGHRYTTTAHRAAWTHYNGPIPDGMTVDHHRATGCCHRPCVRPAHLRLLTNIENATDNGMVARRTRPPAGVLCGCGEEKVAVSGGRPVCRTCTGRSRREWRARRRAAGLPVT